LAAHKKIRVRLKGYDHEVVDRSSAKIVETVTRNGGARVSGPVPLPTEIKIITILRSANVNKDSREQFEICIHKRLIDILEPSNRTVETLTNMELSAGVEIDIKL